MRVLWKMSVIVLLGVGIQWGIGRWANDIDEAAFAFRVFCAGQAGVPFHDPELVGAAQRLFERRCRRSGFCAGSDAAEPGTLVLASAADMD